MHGPLLDRLHGKFGRIGDQEAVGIGGIDRACRGELLAQEVKEGLPVVLAHENERKFLNFLRLDKRRCLEDLVERAEAAWHGDKGIGILDEDQLADEEMAKGEPAVEIGIRLLFLRSLMLQPTE